MIVAAAFVAAIKLDLTAHKKQTEITERDEAILASFALSGTIPMCLSAITVLSEAGETVPLLVVSGLLLILAVLIVALLADKTANPRT